jgi:hypothetical protein
MRRLLQSKIAVVCLLAAASMAWFVSSRRPAPPAVPAEDYEVSEPVEELDPGAEEPAILPPLAIDTALRRWEPSSNAAVRPDPFVYPAPPETKPIASEASVATPPALQAISVGARKPLAVLDRRVVGEGERLGPWLITRIEADVVRVDGPGGPHELRLSRGPALPENTPPEQRSNFAGGATGEKSPAVEVMTSGPNNGMP